MGKKREVGLCKKGRRLKLFHTKIFELNNIIIWSSWTLNVYRHMQPYKIGATQQEIKR